MHLRSRANEPRFTTRESVLRGHTEIRRSGELGKLGAPVDIVADTCAPNLVRLLNDGTAIIEPHRIIGRRIVPIWLVS